MVNFGSKLNGILDKPKNKKLNPYREFVADKPLITIPRYGDVINSKIQYFW